MVEKVVVEVIGDWNIDLKEVIWLWPNLKNMIFVIDDGWWQFATNMVGPQEDNSICLCIINTAVRNKESVKIGHMMFKMDYVDVFRLIFSSFYAAYNIYNSYG